MPSRRNDPANRCLQCGGEMRWVRAFFCTPCKIVRDLECGKDAASGAVAKAIRRGDLPHPATLQCVDCGSGAQEYDHRDYGRPLEVEPTCRRCNNRRGSGKWLKHKPLRELLQAAA